MSEDKKSTKRSGKRKKVAHVEISELTSMSNYAVVANQGIVINASTSGMLIEVDRKEFIGDEFQGTLNLDQLIGQELAFFIPQMNLDLDGIVVRTDHMGKGIFHIGIQFGPNIPEYWRECLIDLLPSGEQVAFAF